MKRLFLIAIVMSIIAVFGTAAAAATYLGVATEPTHPEVGAHLQLPQGAGITVRYVDPQGPAADALKPNDVLFKIDEQILVDPRQLAILVRSHKAEDEVRLTLYRRGEMIEKRIALGERDMEQPGPMPQKPPRAWPPAGQQGMFDNLQREMEERWEQFQSSFGAIDEMIEDLNSRMGGQPVAPNANVQKHSSVSISSIQNGMRFNYSSNNGDQRLEVIDAEGNTVFDGPINTEEQLDQVPPEAAAFLDSIDVDIDYEPAEEVELIPSDAI